MRMNFNGPLIFVEDEQRSKRFYETLLEQKLRFDFGACQIFESGLTLQATRTTDDLFGIRREDVHLGGHSMELYFESEDFDEFLVRLRAQSDIAYPYDATEVHTHDWGQRAVRFYDPDRHLVEVAETMRAVIQRFADGGMEFDEIVRVTEHPADFVRECLR